MLYLYLFYFLQAPQKNVVEKQRMVEDFQSYA